MGIWKWPETPRQDPGNLQVRAESFQGLSRLEAILTLVEAGFPKRREARARLLQAPGKGRWSGPWELRLG